MFNLHEIPQIVWKLWMVNDWVVAVMTVCVVLPVLSLWCSLSSVRCDITHTEAVSVLPPLPPHYSALSRHTAPLHSTPLRFSITVHIMMISISLNTPHTTSLLTLLYRCHRSGVRRSRPQCQQTRCFQYWQSDTTFQILITSSPLPSLSLSLSLFIKI